MSSKPFDQAFKYLAEEDPEGLLLFIRCIKAGQHATIKPVSREVSVSVRLPDQPYEVTIDGNSRIVNVEAQTVYDPNMPDRMLDYAVRLWLKHRLGVTSYLLLLTDRGVPQELPSVKEIKADDLMITHFYHPVCLWEMSGREALAMERDSLVPFIPLMKDGPEVLAEGAKRLAEAPEGHRRVLGLHFLLLGGLRYNKQELSDLIGSDYMIPLEQLRESSIYQDILEEGRQEGEKKGRLEGREEGRREGREEGKQLGEAALLRRLLVRRFGRLPDRVLEAIESADSDTLADWALRAFEADSLDDLFS